MADGVVRSETVGREAMTREEIMRLKTGRELDRAVYRVLYQVDAYSPAYYSRRVECAFLALHLFLSARPGWGYNIGGDLAEVRVDLRPPDGVSFWWVANELPDAICRAILLAAEEGK